MKNENRKDERFDDIGRVDATELCALSGILDDISLTGCKVCFPISVPVDMENEYKLKIHLSRKNKTSCLDLIGKPQWKKDADNKMQIGFSILRSRNTPELNDYIKFLKSNSEEKDDISSLILNQQVSFI